MHNDDTAERIFLDIHNYYLKPKINNEYFWIKVYITFEFILILLGFKLGFDKTKTAPDDVCVIILNIWFILEIFVLILFVKSGIDFAIRCHDMDQLSILFDKNKDKHMTTDLSCISDIRLRTFLEQEAKEILEMFYTICPDPESEKNKMVSVAHTDLISWYIMMIVLTTAISYQISFISNNSGFNFNYTFISACNVASLLTATLSIIFCKLVERSN